MILFSEQNHLYTENNKILLSVSGLIKKVEEPFDSELNACRMFFKKEYSKLWKEATYKRDHLQAVEYCKSILDESVYRQFVDDIKLGWSDKGASTSSRGTIHHATYENNDYARGYGINPYNKKKFKVIENTIVPKGYENSSICDDMYDLEDGYYPELLIFNRKFNICGQSDRIFIETIGNKRYIDGDDYKFIPEMTKTAYFDRLKGYKTLKYPVSHIHHTKFNIFILKISTYAWMLEQAGFIIRSLFLRQCLELLDKSFIEIEHALPYKKDEIDSIVNTFCIPN